VLERGLDAVVERIGAADAGTARQDEAGEQKNDETDHETVPGVFLPIT
jgi:hypothetical protein